MLRALAKIISVYKDKLDEIVFKEKLGAISVKQLVRIAKDRRPGSMGIAEAMIIEYNGKKKSPAYRLSINKLYASDNDTIEEYDEPEDEFIKSENHNDTQLEVTEYS